MQVQEERKTCGTKKRKRERRGRKGTRGGEEREGGRQWEMEEKKKRFFK